MRISAFQKKNNLGDRITQSNGINRASEEDNVTITSQRSEGDAENVTTSLEGDKVPFESGETVNESRVETESVTICAPGEDKVPYAESIKSVLQSEAVIQATSEYSEGRSDSNEVTTRRWALLFISMLND